MCRPYIDTNNPQGMQIGRFENRTPENKFVNGKLEKKAGGGKSVKDILLKIKL
jgi:hypothetical protein